MCVVRMERKKVAAADDVSGAVAKRYCAETDMIRSECNDGDRDIEDGDHGDERDEFYPSKICSFIKASLVRIPIPKCVRPRRAPRDKILPAAQHSYGRSYEQSVHRGH